MMKMPETKKQKALLNVLLAIGAMAICIAVAVVSITPQTYDIKKGEISTQTITAPNNVIDEVSTQRLIEEEQAKVGPSYKKDANITQQIIKKADEDFTSFENARLIAEDVYKADQEAKQKAAEEAAAATATPQANQTATSAAPTVAPYVIQPFDPAHTDWATLLTKEKFNEIKAALPEYMGEEDALSVIKMTAQEITSLKNAVKKQIQKDLYSGISGNNIDLVKNTIVGEVADQLDLSGTQEAIVSKLISNDVYPNMVFDDEATQAERERVAAMVTPEEYKKGQNIVLKGEVVTAEQYQVLKNLGLLTTESTSITPYLAVVIYIVLLFMLYTVFLAVFNRKLLMNIKKIAILAILTAIAYLVTALAQIVAVHIYPIILFVILGAVLLSPKNALVYSVFLSLLLMSVTTNGQDLISSASLIILLTTLTGSFFAIYTLKNMQYRSKLVLAGLVAVIPGVCIEIIIYLLKMINMQQMFYGMAIMTGSGVLCGIVSIGVLPLIENAFKLTTPTKLLELSDPNHPLIKRLVLEAPGTYHHSILVANLAEAACNAVGGFSLLARVGAYFHDVGKIENPLYFKENQRNNVNPHDDLTPKQSAAIIRKHVPDGVALMNKHKMPQELVDIVKNHHGNGTVGYFYYEALEKDKNVNVEDYTYCGEPPRTKEGAIIMLSDIVEAAVRSMDNPSREQIGEMVKKLIKARYDEGQLDNAPLNRQDLNQITEAFMNIFDGVYHQRIQYPQIKIHGVDDEDNVI